MFASSKLLSTLRVKFVLDTVYVVNPDTSPRDTHLFLFQSLVPYATIRPNFQPDIETWIVLYGDFNVDNTQGTSLLDFMKEHFNRDCVSESSSTLGWFHCRTGLSVVAEIFFLLEAEI
jgi:hypothetical protein